MIKREYAPSFAFEPSRNEWSGYVTKVPGATARGSTKEEMIGHLLEDTNRKLTELKEAGFPLPESDPPSPSNLIIELPD